jgi:small subunit ribosomal protein S18
MPREERGGRERSAGGFGGGGKMRRPKKRVCNFCIDKVEHIDYKDVNKIRRYVSERGKIIPRRISGNCAKHQRQTTVAIKRARNIAFLPFTTD